jgi:hypothetical protein
MALVVDRKTGEVHYLPLKRAEDELRGSLDARQYAVPYVPGDDATSALASLASQLDQDGFDFRACDNCRWFRITGASQQQTDGWGGYCTIVAQRNVRALVSPDYACLQWSGVGGWPDDVPRMRADREQAERSARPDRHSNYVGCSVGFWRASILAQSPLGSADHRIAIAQQFLELVRQGFQALASALLHEGASPEAVADHLAATFPAAHSSLALLAAATPVGLVSWKDEHWSSTVIDGLANRYQVVRSDRLAAKLACRLLGWAMSKRPYGIITSKLERWISEEAAGIGSALRPWLKAGKAAAAPDNSLWRSVEQDDPAHVVAAAWYAWHTAGGLFDPIVDFLSSRNAIASGIAGALSGAVHGAAAITRDSHGEDASFQTWVELGERLFGLANNAAHPG